MGKASLALLGVLVCITVGYAAGKKAAVEMSATDLKWSEVPDTGGVQVAPLWGEMMKGAHGMMAKFPPGHAHERLCRWCTLRHVPGSLGEVRHEAGRRAGRKAREVVSPPRTTHSSIGT